MTAPSRRSETSGVQKTSLGVGKTTSIEPLLKLADLPVVLSCGSRTVERLRSAGRLPKPDLLIGTGSRKSPRWKPETIRQWIENGGSK